MQKIESLFTKELILRSLSLGLAFALVEFFVKVAIHAAFGEYGAFDYSMGALVGFFSNFLLGMLLAVPLGLRQSLGFLSYALIGLFLVYDVFAYLIHAETGHIPTLEALFAQFESASGGFYAKGLIGGALALLATIGLASLIEKRALQRYENVRVRIADTVTVFIFGALGFLTLLGGVGPVYYGTVPPLFHLASGRAPTDPNPSVNLPHDHRHHHHDHEHHRHEHGFVPEEKREPFPEDGIPRPVESMRLQYQGLLGAERFLPIRDTAYPFCRDEPAAAEASRPHDLIVVDLAGLGREAFGQDPITLRGALLDELLDEALPRIDLKHIYTVSVDDEAGRRALLTGMPPLVPPSLVQATRALPAGVSLPRLPSLAEELRRQGGFQTAYFGPAKPFHGDALPELMLQGFDRYGFATSAEDPVRADLESLKRVEMYYLDRSRGPKFAFVELSSTRDGELNDEVREALRRVLRARSEASVILTSSAARIGEARPETRLNIPFIVRSKVLDSERTEILSERLGSSLDLPQTALGLIGAPRRGCFQGRDLLSVDEEFPSRRIVLSELAGREARFALTDSRGHGERRFLWLIDGSDPFSSATPAKLFDPKLDPEMRSDLFSRRDPDWPQLDEFWKSHLAIGAYLLRTDRFIPPPSGDRGAIERSENSKDPVAVSFIEEKLPAAPGSYLYELSSKESAKHEEALAARVRGAELTLEVGAGLFDGAASAEQQLRALLGGAYRPGDSILVNELALALSLEMGADRKIGLRIPFDVNIRLGYFKKIRQLGVDFVYLSLPSDALVESARSAGLEVWTTKAGALLLEARQPDRTIE